MSDGRPASDADRLPWLEPYREPPTRRTRPVKPAKAKPAQRPGRGGYLAMATVVLVAGAVAGGYWLGQREGGSPPAASPQVERAASTTIPPSAPSPAATPPQSPAQTPAPVAVAQASPDGSATVPMAKSRPVAKPNKSVRRAKIRNAGVERANIDKVRRQQGEPVAARPAWPKQPSPGPAGRVIQLGAFSNPDRAYITYRQRIARYPALGRMPRVIVPVARGNNGRLLYVLRLGTGSRQQSRTVCRNLRRSGDHCLVIG